MADAITSATWEQHGTHTLVWDLTDTGGDILPDGAHRIPIELTEQNGSGKLPSIEVAKGPEPFSLTPPDQSILYSP